MTMTPELHSLLTMVVAFVFVAYLSHVLLNHNKGNPNG
jgi:cbb3-type cytochrome oxidase subunit 3